MSHNVNYTSYPENVNRRSVQDQWDEIVRREDYQEGATGLNGYIRWIEKAGILEDKDDAKSYIESHDSGWYDQLAVRYYAYPELKKSAKLISLDERRTTLAKKRYDLMHHLYYKDAKSKYIGCKHCGSKLSNEYLMSNMCPLCHNDLRPDSFIEKLAAVSKKYDEVNAEFDAEMKKLQAKQKKNIKVMWLVKTEYHT